MDILFASEGLRKACNVRERGVRKWGQRRAVIVGRRLDELHAAETLEDVRHLGGCHELKGNRRGQIAVRLDGGFRLIFAPDPFPGPVKPDGGLDWKRVTAIKILGVIDYHD